MTAYGERQVVVGAAILAATDGAGVRVLATQRAKPPSLAGLWEFPGGKVEAGETEVGALVRECHEELGLVLEVGMRVGEDVATADGAMTLRVYEATVTSGELCLTEHSASRWLTAAELDDVPWIPSDQPVVEALRSVMTARSR